MDRLLERERERERAKQGLKMAKSSYKVEPEQDHQIKRSVWGKGSKRNEQDQSW
jgi:hypothetical protein